MNMKTGWRSGRSGGFTLIELLVVITIMLIVMAIMLPTVARMLSRSRRIVCLSNTRQLSFAWFCYAGDNGGNLAGCSPGGGGWVDVDNTTASLTNGVLWPYLKEVKIYKCPGSRVNVPPNILAQNRSVSINDWLNGTQSKATTLSGIRSLPRTLTFIEEFDDRGYLMGGFAMWGGDSEWTDTVGVFHDNGDNYGYADGHAEFRAYRNPGFLISVRGQHYVSDPNDVDCAWVNQHMWPTQF